MKISVNKFVTPDAQVKLSSIMVDPKERKATLTLGTKEKGKRKFTEREVVATITSELYHWLTQFKDEKVKVEADNTQGFQFIKTGNRSTGFQKFLAKSGKKFKPGILQSMEFVSHNNSKEYQENPFRLVVFKDRAVLTLVNIPSKARREVIDLSTGEVKTTYHQKYGKFADNSVTKAFVRPERYRRLVEETVTKVNVIS